MHNRSDIDSRRATLSAKARVLLERRLGGEDCLEDTGPRSRIPRRDEAAGPAPLSFAQQRLWFLEQLAPGTSFYNMPIAIPFRSGIDPAILARSVNELVQRHESLRTTFAEIGRSPVQVVAPQLRLDVPVIDLSSLPAPEREHEALRLSTEEARAPFDLAAGPLLRAKLIKRSYFDHILLFTFHHVICDSWSAGVFLGELTATYQALTLGWPPRLPELPIQYADYAVWQRQQLQGSMLERQLNHWRTRLADLPTLQMPTDRSRPAVKSYEGATHPVTVSAALTGKIEALSRQNGVTPFMTLTAAFKAVLHHYARQDDIVIGSAIAGRDRVETENLIGFFVNSLVLRTDLSGDPTFLTLLQRVREMALDAFAHQDLPFEMLVDELQPERDLSRNPLFQVTFQLINMPPAGSLAAPAAAGSVPSQASSALPVNRGTAIFDIAFTLFATPSGMIGGIDYDTDLFEADTIERLAGHFTTFLEAAVADPGLPLSRLPLLAGVERHQVLIEFNRTQRDWGGEPCLHELFERQAERTSDGIAVEAGAERISYGELNRRADLLAAHLTEVGGVGPDCRVALCFDRGIPLVCAMLGVLKAGGAYVPLDPSYPRERLEFMLADCGARLILTDGSMPGDLDVPGVAALRFGDIGLDGCAADADAPAARAVPDNLAYVIYTSGSTGTPRGVMIPHRAISNHMLWMAEAFPLRAEDRVLQRTPYSFDASVWEFWAPLLSGARLVMHAPARGHDSSALLDVLRTRRITILQLVPTLLSIMVEEPEFAQFQSLRRVFCGGERLSPELAKRFFEVSGAELCNLYGPTEATIDATAWTCSREAAGAGLPVPIGHLVANLRAYVLDRTGAPVPIGVPGELHLAGTGLARGYLNRPGLTADRFVPDPFSEESGARLYRTDDLARWRADGTLEFLGRNDQQVKLHGHRIELGEIETAIQSHPAIAACIVVLREGHPSSRRHLIAYVVAKRSKFDVDRMGMAMRQYLQGRLPHFMVPSGFVWLDQLPQLANGKVDVKALPARDGKRADDRKLIPPANPREERLAEIWAEVLGLDKVGMQDNFFELGGDSIMSIQIVARAKAAGMQLTPQQIFQHQTIADLAAVAEAPEGSTPAEQGPVTGPVPLTPIQRWFVEQDLEESHHFNQAVLFECGPGMSAGALQRAIAQLEIHHDALRLRLAATADGWSQEIAPIGEGIAAGFDRFDLAGLAPSELHRVVEGEAARLHAGLNLREGPLMRASLFQRGGDARDLLLLIIHHLAVDGVSWRILLEDLQVAYAQSAEGREIRLPPKTASFRRWAEWLEGCAASQSVRSELPFWLEQGAGAGALPLDHAPGADAAGNLVGTSDTLTVQLDRSETDALLHESGVAFGARADEVLLAALVGATSEWTGSSELLVDIEGHGRESGIVGEDDAAEAGPDVTRTVGWFTTIFPLRLDTGGLAGDAAPRELLHRVKERLRAVPRRGIGYGLLRYHSPDAAVRGSLALQPQPPIVFNYLGRFGGQPAEVGSTGASEGNHAVGPLPSAGPMRSRRGVRRHLIEVNASIGDRRLEIALTYSRNHHRRETIESLGARMVDRLRALTADARAADAGSHTPSDFARARVSQRDLDTLLGKLRSSQAGGSPTSSLEAKPR